jgi:hypothetical protein
MITPTVRTTIDLDRDLYIQLKQIVAVDRQTIKSVMREAVRDVVRKKKVKKQKSFEQLWKEIRAIATAANKRSPERKSLTQILIEERDERYHENGYL